MNIAINSAGDWKRADPKSYNKAARAGLLKEICKQLGLEFRDSEGNKKKLLEMARNGASRPKSKTKLGDRLCRYSSPCSSYDDVFTKELRSIRPDWFDDTDRGLDNLEVLLSLDKRPNGRSEDPEEARLGRAIQNMKINRPELFNKLKKAKPHWFIDDQSFANLKVLLLLKERPSAKSKNPEHARLGEAIMTMKKHRPELYDQLTKAKPNWFIDRPQSTLEALLLLKKRPSQGSKDPEEARLARAINNLRHHRPELFEKLVKAKPHWFKRGGK